MRAYSLDSTGGPEELKLAELPDPSPGAGEVLVRIAAVSLNSRDLAVVRGTYGFGLTLPLVPCSDGAGEVVAAGPGARRFAPGDRVAATFFPDWRGGEVSEGAVTASFGAGGTGMLAERVVLPEEALVRVPAHLSFEEAACLPCAAVTAWHSLMAWHPVKASETVLVQGSGGVSVFALQFARLAGARVIATSASDEKRQRLEALGAAATVNYRATPDWDKAVRGLAGGEGVDVVVEVAGAGTLARSLGAIKTGGRIALVGVLTGRGEINPMPILRKSAQLYGIRVGSRAMFEEMNAAIARHGLRPVIDRVFEFAQAPAAYGYLASGAHFGKVCIRIG
jgi:2-desacetyl-2-hydroxyethyl bacteriochlorophyllide A dehydrogenase